jgi:acylphosphatase
MDELESKSEVARFRKRQALEEEAMRLGLYGFAEAARHGRINARMTRGAERILDLIAEGKDEEAQVMMNQENWGAAEEKEQTKEELEV